MKGRKCACVFVSYVCIHVCMSEYGCINVFMYLYKCTCMLYTCMHICTYDGMFAHMSGCMDVCMYACMHVCNVLCTSECRCVCVFIFAAAVGRKPFKESVEKLLYHTGKTPLVRQSPSPCYL